MSKVNKYADLIINHYNNYDEDNRFTKSKGTKVEYLTNMRYIHKYLKPGMKILELGAGTGAYCITLAKEGYDVTAIELVESNLNILKTNAKRKRAKLTAEQGDALDLSRFADGTFDMVLSLGPMYHLYTNKDKQKAVQEAVRVCKKNGIVMFAYILHSSTVWTCGIKNGLMEHMQPYINKDGSLQNVPEEIFATFYTEEFDKLMAKTATKHLTTVSSDSLAYMLRDQIDALTKKQYEMFLNWHYNTCERKDQLGWSCHNLYICRKI